MSILLIFCVCVICDTRTSHSLQQLKRYISMWITNVYNKIWPSPIVHPISVHPNGMYSVSLAFFWSLNGTNGYFGYSIFEMISIMLCHFCVLKLIIDHFRVECINTIEQIDCVRSTEFERTIKILMTLWLRKLINRTIKIGYWSPHALKINTRKTS